MHIYGIVSKHPSIRKDQLVLEQEKKNPTVTEPYVANKSVRLLLCGGIAGCVTKTSVAPLERMKILYQLDGMRGGTRKYTSIFSSFKTVIKEEGVVSLWKGNGANVVRVIPVYALKFGFNDKFKDMFRHPGHTQLSRMEQMAAGTTAGLFTTSATYPLDNIRTRLSLASGNGVSYNGIFDCGIRTAKKEGVSGLYKGIGMTFLSGAPYVGLQMTFYEIGMKDIEPCHEIKSNYR